jgi:acetyl-CoA carboxylase biotin carboxyl carrier protein
MDMSPADIRLILAALQESGFDQAEITVGDVRVAIARGGAQLHNGSTTTPTTHVESDVKAPVVNADNRSATGPETAPTSTSASASTPAIGTGHVVASPSVGVFWRAPEPGSAAYVEIGQEVSVGDTVGIVEVMKLMNNISADVAGVVTAIHVENAGSVEFGTALITIEPKA